MNLGRGMEIICHSNTLEKIIKTLDTYGVLGHFIIIEHDIDNNWDMPLFSGHTTEDFYKFKNSDRIPNLLREGINEKEKKEKTAKICRRN